MPGEAFMDTPIISGTAYPYLEVEPRAYRFCILNAADDRFFNLQFYVADQAVISADGRAFSMYDFRFNLTCKESRPAFPGLLLPGA